MSTPADELVAIFDDAEAELVDALFADTYRIVRMTDVPDGYGGTTPTETYPETGRCLLQRTQMRGGEAANGYIVLSRADYIAQLPSNTTLLATDILEVNTTRYNVITVKQGGNVGVFTTAELEVTS